MSKTERAAYVPLAALLLAMLAACGEEPATGDPAASRLILYTSLPDERALAIVRAYPEASGTVIHHMLESDDVLIRKMADKEHHPGADVLLISGAGALARAVDHDVLRPIRREMLTAVLDEPFRDPDAYWFAVGFRAELIAYDRRVVDAMDIRGYAALADERWRDKLCLQRGDSERSRSLAAAMIAVLGERDAELAVRGWRENLATSTFDEQRELLAAIERGECPIGIVSSDEYARFVAGGDARNLSFTVPDDDAGGTQLDLTAVGVSRHANDADAAVRFVEWLVSADGQRVLHESHYDFPVDDVLPLPPPMNEWPRFAVSPVHASRTGYLHTDAELLIERARFR